MAMEDRRREALEGRGRRENYASAANLEKRQALFGFGDPTRSSGVSPLERVRWRGDERVLDAGCGNGVWLRTLAEGFGVATVVGLDLSEGMLAAAREAGASRLVAGDLQSLPFGDETFDAVLCLWMLYHVASHEAALAEVRRVLRPGGVLVAATNSASPRRLDRVLSGALETVTGVARASWLPPLSFTAENGEAVLGRQFPDVDAATRRSAFAVPTPEPVLAAMESVRGPVELFVGERPDWHAVAAEARREVEAIIAAEGAFRTEIVTATFVATKRTD